MSRGGGRPLHVLIVDDEHRLVALMGRALVEAGHTVDVAHDGLSGHDRAIGSSHDVIILDVQLPGLDGLEVCRALRAAGCRAGILLASACDAVEACVAGFTAGADDYLVKPFAVEELCARVHALGRRSSCKAVPAITPAATPAEESPPKRDVPVGLAGRRQHVWAASAPRRGPRPFSADAASATGAALSDSRSR